MQLVRRVLAGLLLLMAAACNDSGPVNDPAVDLGDLAATATAGPTVAEVLAKGNDSVTAEAAPAPFDHLGTWAAAPALCRGGTWRFTAAGVSTEGETSCQTAATSVVSGTSKKLTMRCISEGFETFESWALNLHSDGTMTVSRSEGGNGVPRSVTLERCG